MTTPLNTEALEQASREVFGRVSFLTSEQSTEFAQAIINAYLTAAQPGVTGEQVNFAGWTCNGIHEPGGYLTCNECREACDDLANFYNQMMWNPRRGKRWTGDTVNTVEERDAYLEVILEFAKAGLTAEQIMPYVGVLGRIIVHGFTPAEADNQTTRALQDRYGLPHSDQLNQARAEAWEVGYTQGRKDQTERRYSAAQPTNNPYKGE